MNERLFLGGPLHGQFRPAQGPTVLVALPQGPSFLNSGPGYTQKAYLAKELSFFGTRGLVFVYEDMDELLMRGSLFNLLLSADGKRVFS